MVFGLSGNDGVLILILLEVTQIYYGRRCCSATGVLILILLEVTQMSEESLNQSKDFLS